MQWAYTTCLIFSDSRWRNLKLLRCWEQTGGQGWGRSKSTMCHFTSISSFSLKQTYTSRTLISILTTETPNVTWKKWHHGCQTVSTECLQCYGDQSQESGSYFLPMESLGGGRVGSDWEDLDDLGFNPRCAANYMALITYGPFSTSTFLSIIWEQQECLLHVRCYLAWGPLPSTLRKPLVISTIWSTKRLCISSVQSLSRVWLFATPWTTASQASLFITNSRSPPKPMFIVSVMPSNHLIVCHPLLLLTSIFPSVRVFSNESALLIKWPKDWSFSFNITPSKEYPRLIFLRMDWLDLLAVQGTLKCLLQHHSSKASILQCSAFFILSHSYMTTGKTIALTRRTFVDKVMSLLFNMVSRLVITFLPRSKRLLISWLQSPSAVILEPRKLKS